MSTMNNHLGVAPSSCAYMRQLQVTTWTLTKFKEFKDRNLPLTTYDDFIDLAANDTPDWFCTYTDIINGIVDKLLTENK